MFKKKKVVLIFIPMFFASGCSSSVNRELSPPEDTRWVNVEIKNPLPYTAPFPLEVRYISYKCKKKRISGFDGSIITEPSYNVISVSLQQQSDDIWTGKVATIGGGTCKWSLSAITLGIEYIDATHIEKDLVPGTAVGAEIAFDNDASKNGQFRIVDGDLKITPKYYPYIRERKILEKKKSLSLFGKESFIPYRALNLENIYFHPEIDERKITRRIEPEKKIDGVYSKIIYPDGSIAPERTLFPDFNKVEKMEVK
ncbi:hypothetical protein [Erwinia sp. CGal63]|uniref:hypothetical protein n=1 Tax=Erwinia sp. CGal63 TaxID=2919889 RepID=UPI00300AD078